MAAAQISRNKCDICEESFGTKFCRECHKFLCDGCRKNHDKFIKGHIIIDSCSVSKVVNRSELFCKTHDLVYLHFCDNCNCLTCSKCTTTEHKGHLFHEISEKAKVIRTFLSETRQTLKTKCFALSNLIEKTKCVTLTRIQQDTEQFKSASKSTCIHIKEIVDAITDISITYAQDYLTLEEQQVKYSLSKLQKVYDEGTAEIVKIEQLLQEQHDLTFYIQHKKSALNLEEIDEIPDITEPTKISVFDPDKFANDVFDQISQKYKTRIKDEYETTLKQMQVTQDENEQLKTALSKIRTEANNSEERYKAEIKKQEDIIKNLSDEGEDLRKEIYSVIKETEKVTEEKNISIQKLQSDIAIGTTENQKLQKDRNKIEEEAQKNKNIVNQLEQDKLALNVRFQARIKEQEDIIKTLNNESTELRKETERIIKEKNTIIQQLQHAISMETAEHRKTQAVKNKQEQDLQIETNRVKELEQDILALNLRTKENEESNMKQMQDIQTEKDNLKSLLSNLAREKDDTESRLLKERTTEIKELKQTLHDIKNEAKLQLEAFDEQLRSLHWQFRVLQEDIELRKESDMLRNTMFPDKNTLEELIAEESVRDFFPPEYLLTVAIEIGTRTSSCGMNILGRKNTSYFRENGLDTMTALLLNDKKEFVEFGSKAYNYFQSLIEKQDDENWYYFHKFRRMLTTSKVNDSEWLMKTYNGKKTVPALLVYSLAIEYFKDRVINEIQRNDTGHGMNDIKWILTYPSAANSRFQRFLLKAAEQAGIGRNRLVLISEPHASVFDCRELFEFDDDKADVSLTHETGIKCLIVNCGSKLGYLIANISYVQKIF